MHSTNQRGNDDGPFYTITILVLEGWAEVSAQTGTGRRRCALRIVWTRERESSGLFVQVDESTPGRGREDRGIVLLPGRGGGREGGYPPLTKE